MQTDVSNVLSDLKTLSDNADQIIQDSNFGNDQVGKWFSIIKETAVAIVKGTYFQKSTGAEKSSCFSKDDLPNLITLVKGKQNSHRVSALLAEVQKDKRVRLSHRKSRKSLRKIVLGKKSGNQWKISNRNSSLIENNLVDEDTSTSATPKVKDRLLESQFRSPLNSSTSKNLHSKSYFSELDSSSKGILQTTIGTPCQSKDILASNTEETTPITHSKLKPTIGSITVVKPQKRNLRFSSQNSISSENKTPVESDTFSNKSEKITSLIIKSNSAVSKESIKSDDEFLTPDNKTINLDSDGSAGNKYETPVTRSKRKSSVQHTQENAKKIKCTTSTSQVLANKHNNSKWDENFTGNNAFKQIKLAKEINPVIPVKNLLPQNQPRSEKRILREIQKKEEKVNQNAKKLRSMQKMKMEENKKARERKMEKALQQRMKIEKEKEERIRSRTQSKQENLQQPDTASKKAAAQKRVEPIAVVKKSSKSQHEDKCEPPRKPLRSPVKKVRISPVEQKLPKCAKNVVEVDKTYVHDPSPKEIANTKLLNNLNATYVRSPADVENNSTPSTTNEKAPPKPIRSVKKLSKTSYEISAASSKPVPSACSSISTCSVKADNYHSSTPVAKKVESKLNLAKTPVMNKAKKPNSYAMTPHEGSFVSYDISEIKSDDSDEEESTPQNKQIPSWASGVHLRTALLNQHYAPIKIDELFGNFFEPPNLSQIMGTEKRHYHKRTSSAIWLDSPNRSRSYYT